MKLHSKDHHCIYFDVRGILHASASPRTTIKRDPSLSKCRISELSFNVFFKSPREGSRGSFMKEKVWFETFDDLTVKIKTGDTRRTKKRGGGKSERE